MIEAFILVCAIGGRISPDDQSFGFDDFQRPFSPTVLSERRKPTVIDTLPGHE
jgi:hypothetical protein